ncbi:U3 small nucleolar RNA-associated protein 18 homolog [Durusdinium trenchii]|uniref:U3 small nucleolar RNA-associated protein 18 homolog n=1 Tax=Durusdinium trenchii TaxID=1381693 RepID=A0ABP0M0K8_9DINO
MVKNRKRKAAEPSEAKDKVSTAELEAIVFGGASFQGEEKSEQAKEAKEAKEDVEEAPETGARRAAWVDPDDADLEVPLVGRRGRLRHKATHVTGEEYEQLLRQQFTKLNGVARWTEKQPTKELSDSEEEEEEFEAIASSMPAVARGGSLKPTQIDLQRLPELPLLANGQRKGSSAIEALQFHPNSELLLTGGRDKTLRLFAVDGDENPKVASYFFKQFPILCATFTPTGDQILMSSTTSQMWGLDVSSGEAFEVRNVSSDRSNYRCLVVGPSPSMVSGLKTSQMYGVLGDGGAINICDIKSKHNIRTLRMGAPGAALLFAPHKDVVYSADSECNIYEWDISTGRCRQKIKESWATGIRCMATSQQSLAIGTSTGNVDLLDLSGPKLSGTPIHSIGNLTTRVDCVRYSPDGQILGICSRMKSKALRLVHSGTATVFQNWPTEKTPLDRASVFDFSKQGVMAIGNETGRVLLYRLRHYIKSD